MTEEIKNQAEQKNTVATVGMRFSIIWLIALISIILSRLWLPLLFIWLILWIVGLFYRPRKRARIAVCIPLIVLIVIICVACYLWKSVKGPANEFMEWVEPQFEQLQNSENFDGERFGDILEAELNNMTNGKSENEWKDLFEASTGSNSLEKGAYMLSSIFKEWFENALERYNNGEVVEINDEDNNIISVDIDVKDENEEDIEDTEEEITIEQPKKTNNETFSQSEKNDIEEILDILE